MPRPNTQVSHHGAGGRSVISWAVRSDSVGSSGHFKVLGTVGSIAFSRSRRRLSSNVFSRRSIASLSSRRRHICVFVTHTGARNSRNRFRRSSTGEELSKHSADDSRGARAVCKLRVIGPELDDGSSGNPSTTIRASCTQFSCHELRSRVLVHRRACCPWSAPEEWLTQSPSGKQVRLRHERPGFVHSVHSMLPYLISR